MKRDTRMNNGFYDLDPEERAYLKEKICEKYGVTDFCDLSAEERADLYDNYCDDRYEGEN